MLRGWAFSCFHDLQHMSLLDMTCERVHLSTKSLNGRTARHSLTSENFQATKDCLGRGLGPDCRTG